MDLTTADGTDGVHNPDYAIALLNEANKKANEILTGAEVPIIGDIDGNQIVDMNDANLFF